MIRWLPAAGFLAVALTAAAPVFTQSPAFAQSYVVPQELWDRPRSGRTVLEQPAVRQAVNACLAQPGSRLVVRHGPGQDAQLAAEEMRSWLAALAVEPSRIALLGDLKTGEPLRLEVVSDK
jgi:hypothetical protein